MHSIPIDSVLRTYRLILLTNHTEVSDTYVEVKPAYELKLEGRLGAGTLLADLLTST